MKYIVNHFLNMGDTVGTEIEADTPKEAAEKFSKQEVYELDGLMDLELQVKVNNPAGVTPEFIKNFITVIDIKQPDNWMPKDYVTFSVRYGYFSQIWLFRT